MSGVCSDYGLIAQYAHLYTWKLYYVQRFTCISVQRRLGTVIPYMIPFVLDTRFFLSGTRRFTPPPSRDFPSFVLFGWFSPTHFWPMMTMTNSSWLAMRCSLLQYWKKGRKKWRSHFPLWWEKVEFFCRCWYCQFARSEFLGAMPFLRLSGV